MLTYNLFTVIWPFFTPYPTANYEETTHFDVKTMHRRRNIDRICVDKRFKLEVDNVTKTQVPNKASETEPVFEPDTFTGSCGVSYSVNLSSRGISTQHLLAQLPPLSTGDQLWL